MRLTAEQVRDNVLAVSGLLYRRRPKCFYQRDLAGLNNRPAIRGRILGDRETAVPP